MKSLAIAATFLSVGFAAATPAMAGHDVHVQGHYVYAAPGFSISVGVGSPAPYVYGYGYGPAPVYGAPPPVYFAPARVHYGLPVVVAPHACNTRLRAHYVYRDGRYQHHKGHGHSKGHGGGRGHGGGHGHGRH